MCCYFVFQGTKMLWRLVRSTSRVSASSRANAFSLHCNALFSTSMLFDDAQKKFKESVAQFAQEHIAPHAEIIDRTDNFPKDVNLWKLMGDFNLHGLTAPGGSKMNHLY
ncbi:putative 2-methylacyl-CoA dehydrogenase [Helianthus debilis subsp. tardiflorus]